MFRKITYLVLTGCIGIFSSSILAAVNVQQAISDYHRGNFDSALQQFQQISGFPDISQAATANYMLGKMAERGEGLSTNDQIAASYYEKAVSLGHADAEQRLQELNSADDSTVQDWYMEAAWDGDAGAQYSLGYLYETGTGTRIDNARAIQWYEEASKKKHKNAQFRLGLLLVSTEAEIRNIDAGKYWIRAAADNGNAVASSVVKNLFNPADESRMIRTLRGVRTFEQSSFKEMQLVVENSLVIPQLVRRSQTSKPAPKVVEEASKPANEVDDIESSIVAFIKKEMSKLRIASASVYLNDDYRIVIVPILLLMSLLFWHFQRSGGGKQVKVMALPKPREPIITKNGINAMDTPIASSSIEAAEFKFDNAVSVKKAKPNNTAQSKNQNRSHEIEIENDDYDDMDYIIGFEVFLPAGAHDISLSEGGVPEFNISDEEFYSSKVSYDDSGLISGNSVVIQSAEEPIDYVKENYSVNTPHELEALTDEEQIDDDLLAESYYNIGMMFVTGEGVARNEAHGIGWLRRSAEKGHILAEFELDILCDEEREKVKRSGVKLSICG